MKVMKLSLQLTRLNPSFDSMRTEEDGKSCREIFIELRSGGKKIIAKIDETQEGTYDTDFNGFKSLTKESQEEVIAILDEYCATPNDKQLSK